MSHIYFNPNQGDHPHEVVGDSTVGRTKEMHDFKFTILKSYDHQYGDDHHNNTTSRSSSAKCESPKMRLYRKFMKSNDNNQTMDDQNSKQDGSPRESCGESNNSNNNNNSFILVRTCADCNTTKTPLWRSGPHGPKSLCNACGIRQRKARRAAMAASDTPCATNSFNTSKSTTMLNNPLHHTHIVVPTNMKKRSKNRPKNPLFSPNNIHDHQTKKICFREFARNLSNKMSLHQIFPHDEKEAAILLMALSYGFVEG